MRALVVILLVTACSDDDKTKLLPDAPPPPDATDAPGVDAAISGPVTLTISDGVIGIAGVKVYFQAVDSTVVAERTTDASGVATATMEAGGYVTAINPFTAINAGGVRFDDLRTFAGVKPGDQLQLVQDNRPISAVNITILVPIDASASSYFLDTNCGRYDITNPGGSASPGPGGPVVLLGCGATTDLVVETWDASGIPINSFFEASVPLVDLGTIDLTTKSFVATTDATFSYTNVPAPTQTLNISTVLASSGGRLVENFLSSGVTANASSITIKRPGVTGGASITDTLFHGGMSRNHIVEWGAASASYNLDMANVMLPEYATSPVLDIPTHAITWTNAAGGITPDLVYTSVGLQRDLPSVRFWGWVIAAPFTTTTVPLPVLPGADAEYNPLATDFANVNELVTLKVPGGYDAIRSAIHSAIGYSDYVGLAVGASGRALVEELVVNSGRMAPVRPSRVRPRQIAR